jgi:hypothetical protein
MLFRIISMRLILDGIASLHFLFHGKPKHSFAILKAHFHFYHLINRNLHKRTSHQNNYYYNVKSIIYKYFVKSGKVFEH